MHDEDFWPADFAHQAEREADEIESDYPDSSLEALAAELERTRDVYDGGPEFATAVIEVLRRRAAVRDKSPSRSSRGGLYH